MLGDQTPWKIKGLQDSDGDGVQNITDCKPYDPKRQGIIHRLAAKGAEKLGAKGIAGRIKARGEAVDAAKEAAREERYKQMKETAIYREQQRAERKRAYIKRGGFGGAMRRTTLTAAQSISAAEKAKMTTKGKKIKVGKGKKKKYKTEMIKETPRKMPNPAELKLDFPKYNF